MTELENLMMRVAKLEAVEQIKELRYRMHALTRLTDVDEITRVLAEIYTKDAILGYPGSPYGTTEASSILKWATRDPLVMRFGLYLPNWITVESNLETAIGRWQLYQTSTAVNAKTGTEEPILIESYYDDEYRKVDGKWRIHKFTGTFHMYCSVEEGWGKCALDFERYFGPNWQSRSPSVDNHKN